MNSQQDVIYGLMNELEEALDNKGMPLLGFSIVRKDTVTNILDKLYAALPDEIKEEDEEFNKTCNVALMVDYIKRTEKLIRPYYSKKEKEENWHFD